MDGNARSAAKAVSTSYYRARLAEIRAMVVRPGRRVLAVWPRRKPA